MRNLRMFLWVLLILCSVIPSVAQAASTGTAFTYQGQLKKGSDPVNANCLMEFRLYDQANGGNLVGGPIVPTVPVNNSQLTVLLDFGPSAFAGEARWLGIQVNCPGDSGYTDLGRQPITTVPYALSLRPGAVISGSIYNGPVLQLNNNDPSPSGGGYAFSAINYSGNTWRPAIYGENKGASAGVFGKSSGWHGVVGWSQSNASSGVYGYNESGGYGGWFESSSDHYDLVLGGAVGRINTDPNNPESSLILSSNKDVTVRLDNNGGGNGFFRILNSGGANVFTADEQGNVEVAGNLTVVGSKSGYVVDLAQNDDTVSFGVGDVVSISGAGPALVGENPTIKVRLAAGEGKTAVVGVVDKHFFPGSASQDGSDLRPAGPIYQDGLIAPGEFLTIVTLGAFRAIKADASYGAIAPGDLLVASPNPGFAMRAAAPRPGTVVGKALGALPSGTGMIPAIISLQ